MNHLRKETSPYLQQHADNPVDWYPWGGKALDKARKENKPILLSIGYAACHWCHVMAHESFEDDETAAIMNKYFVNVKVDREERPDLDKIYQLAQQMITQKPGGWPLTMFLNPENQLPFYGGTYFPKDTRYGTMPFKEILIKLAEYYHQHHDEINSQNIQLGLAITQLGKSQLDTKTQLTKTPINKLYNELYRDFDTAHGGFGPAPKFPQPTNLQFLLNHWQQHPHDEQMATLVTLSLTKMAQSGLYDQIGGGFFRYSVDERWMIPHFEKMLYDSAQLLSVYCNAYQYSHHSLYICVIIATAEWVVREMQAKKGGYYASLDADSDRVEGKYYYWDREKVRRILDDEEYSLIAKLYGFDRAPNFNQHWHLHSYFSFSDVAKQLNIGTAKASDIMHSSCKKLFKSRQQRKLPFRDEKIIVSWNALMIKAMAQAGDAMDRQDFIDSAIKALAFIQKNMWRNNKLYVSYKDGQANLPAYLDDYAFLLDSCLQLLQIEWRNGIFTFATELADALMQQFYDDANGGFFFTAHNHESLIQRPKSLVDEATPSGNGIAAFVLARFGYLLGETRFIKARDNTLKMAWKAIGAYPNAHTALISALEEYLQVPDIIIIRGKDEQTLKEWRKICTAGFQPHRLVFTIAGNNLSLPKSLNAYKTKFKKTLAYVCKGMQCLAPIDDLDELTKILN